MATFELKMPKLGESVTEGTIGKWLKNAGDTVEKYDLLVEVQTDKVNTEIPAEVSGTLTEIKVKEGDTVPVGALLAVFETADAAAAAAAAATPARTAGGEGAIAPTAQPQQPAPAPQQTTVPSLSGNGRGDGRAAAATAPAPAASGVAPEDIRATP